MLTQKLWNYLWCIDEEVVAASGVRIVWRFHPKSLAVSDVQVDGSFLAAKVDILLFQSKVPDEPLTIPINRLYENHSVTMRLGPVERHPAGFLSIRYDSNALDPNLKAFVVASKPHCDRILQDFTESDSVNVSNFAEGRNNDPLKVSAKFWRMTYFSVVVITTLGFGDIVPMTQASRAWVAVEAMLGTVLTGLMFTRLRRAHALKVAI
ncbi:potassium channel family protein [Bradyrhizobium zhanjiangense]|uniref:potassium channel family protein n=1 Tax=Bradyrhizobium zhanjiangense TaxID=1325107 RepID=UPI001009D363|nr:potassium channel family protein [Bradyrhizobium zhanjiangense]